MRKILKILAALMIALACGFVYDRDGFWRLVAGAPDLGPVDFQTLKSPATRNHFLACPEGYCAEGEADMTTPAYSFSTSRLQALSREAWSEEPRLELVASDTDPLTDRYIQRSPVMRFPDTISVRFVALEGDRSSLAIYSRGQIGRYDFGANRDRVLHLISQLDLHADSN